MQKKIVKRNIRFSPEEILLIDKLSQANERSFSAQVRWMLQQYLTKRAKGK